MVNVTLAIPDTLHNKLSKHPELKWSEIARRAFERKLKEIELEERILAKSRLTERDAEVLGHKIKAEMRKRFT
mgnify:CR=1 FL=1